MVIRWIRSLLSSSKKLVGSDQFGNKYYEILKESGKVQRSVETNAKPEDYTAGQLPHEWEAWIRSKREEAPTQQEIDDRLKYTTLVQKRAVIKERKDDEEQEQAYRDGLIAREKSSGNNPAQEAIAGKPNIRSHASTGISYQPDAWSPGEDMNVTTPVGEAEAWTPEAWTPGGKS